MNAKEKHKAKMLEAFDKIKRCRRWHLKSLEIGNSKALKTFPEEIRQLKWIKKLSVTRTDISELPEWIGEFPELVILNLDSNKIASLPESIGNLKKLKEINLSCNRLQTLPETFGNLSTLESFTLEEISEHHLIDEKYEQEAWFTHLPESFGNLSSLKHFEMHFSLLTRLPESFGSLKSLESLTIQRDMKVDFYFPPSMKNLKSLKRVSFNVFYQVPDFIEELKDLTSLDISHTGVEVLPDFIGDLVKLKELNLHSTGIKELPEWFTKLRNLEYLNVSCTISSIKKEELKKKLPRLKDISDWVNNQENNHG